MFGRKERVLAAALVVGLSGCGDQQKEQALCTQGSVDARFATQVAEFAGDEEGHPMDIGMSGPVHDAADVAAATERCSDETLKQALPLLEGKPLAHANVERVLKARHTK